MKIRYSERATFQLEDIRRYIAQDNPLAARRVISTIRKSISGLTDFPEAHPRRAAETRELVVPKVPYIVVYRFSAAAVEVLGVFHAARHPSVRSST